MKNLAADVADPIEILDIQIDGAQPENERQLRTYIESKKIELESLASEVEQTLTNFLP